VNDGNRLSQLRHPNIVTTFGYEKIDSCRIALVLEHIPGENLDAVLNSVLVEDRLHLATYIASVMTETLAVTHEKGIIHGDISTKNILVSEQGLLKLTDFGLSIDSHGPVERSNQRGTIGYLAPERWLGASSSQASDLFSLGMVVLETLSGKKRFVGTL